MIPSEAADLFEKRFEQETDRNDLDGEGRGYRKKEKDEEGEKGSKENSLNKRFITPPFSQGGNSLTLRKLKKHFI